MLNPTPLSSALASEGEKFMDDDADDDENFEENQLTTPINAVQMPINKAVKDVFKATEIIGKIDKNSSNPRKVRSITVFYDDNSYETFVPQR